MSSLRLLLVDDDIIDRKTVSRCLERSGLDFKLDQVVSVSEACDALCLQSYDCALLDFCLPDGNAYDVLDALQQAGRPRIPIVILTGEGDDSQAEGLLNSGVQDFLLKGHLDGEKLAHAIRFAILRHRFGAGHAPSLQGVPPSMPGLPPTMPVEPPSDTLALQSHDFAVLLFGVGAERQRLREWLKNVSLVAVRLITPRQLFEALHFQSPQLVVIDEALWDQSDPDCQKAWQIVQRQRLPLLSVAAPGRAAALSAVSLERPLQGAVFEQCVRRLLRSDPQSFSAFQQQLAKEAGLSAEALTGSDPTRLYELAPQLGWEQERLARVAAEFLGLGFLAKIPVAELDFRLAPVGRCTVLGVVPLRNEQGELRLAVSNPFDVGQVRSELEVEASLVVVPPAVLTACLDARSGYSTDFGQAREARMAAPPAPPNASLEHAEQLLQKLPGYKVLRLLGKGAMGAVFLACQLKLGREVAVKVLSPKFRPGARYRERFEREARILAQVEHSAIIPIYDIFEIEGYLCIVMGFAGGGCLRDLLDRKPCVEPGLVAHFARNAGLGLWAAARQQVIHRDIKPENLLLTSAGELKIADFGLARNLDEDQRLTRSGTLLGTPHYMAPEYWSQGVADHRADLYALGCTMFELLAGEVPYGGSVMEVMMGHLDTPVPLLGSRRPDIPAGLLRVIGRLLAKDPSGRIQTGEELAELLLPHARVPTGFDPNSYGMGTEQTLC